MKKETRTLCQRNNSSVQCLVWAKGLDTATKQKNDTGGIQGGKKSIHVLGEDYMSIHFCLIYYRLSKYAPLWMKEIVHEKAGYLLYNRLAFDFFFFFKSLIFLTPFPKIVHPFAYLQCDNSAVWNNTLSRVYRWASLICCCDKTKICQHLGTRGRILTVIMNTQLVSLWWESYLPLLLHSTHVRQHLNIKY